MRTNIFSIFKGILTMFLLSVSVSSLAQIKYTSQGKLTREFNKQVQIYLISS